MVDELLQRLGAGLTVIQDDEYYGVFTRASRQNPPTRGSDATDAIAKVTEVERGVDHARGDDRWRLIERRQNARRADQLRQERLSGRPAPNAEE